MGNQSFCPESHFQYHSDRQSYIQKACSLKMVNFMSMVCYGNQPRYVSSFWALGVATKCPQMRLCLMYGSNLYIKKLFFPWTCTNVRRRRQNLKEVYPLSSFMGFICAIPNVSMGLTSEKKNASRVPRTQFSQITIFSHEYFAIYSKARVLSLLAAYENT